MSVGLRHRHATHVSGGPVDSGYVDPKQLVKAEDLLDDGVKIDTSHDVPFIAGMAKDGKTVYIDHALPLHDGGMDVIKPLLVHERVEHMLMEIGMKYDEAHAIASAAEDACVTANGWSLHKYNEFYDKYGRAIMTRGKYKNIPDDLDTEPYQQEGTAKEKQEVEGAEDGEENGEPEGGLMDTKE